MLQTDICILLEKSDVPIYILLQKQDINHSVVQNHVYLYISEKFILHIFCVDFMIQQFLSP